MVQFFAKTLKNVMAVEIVRRDNTSFCFRCTTLGKSAVKNLALGVFETISAILSYGAGLYSADNVYMDIMTNANPFLTSLTSIAQVALPAVITPLCGGCVQKFAKKVRVPSATTTINAVTQIAVFSIRGCDLINQHEDRYPEQAGVQTKLSGAAVILVGSYLIYITGIKMQELAGRFFDSDLGPRRPDRKALIGTTARVGIGSAIVMHYYDLAAGWEMFLKMSKLGYLQKALKNFKQIHQNKTIYKFLKAIEDEGIAVNLSREDELKLDKFFDDIEGVISDLEDLIKGRNLRFQEKILERASSINSQAELLGKTALKTMSAIQEYLSGIGKYTKQFGVVPREIKKVLKETLRHNMQNILSKGLFPDGQ